MIKALAGLSLLTLAHSWYPLECCSDNDCKPVPCDEIQETEGGVTWHGLFFAQPKVKASQDKDCHICHIGERTYCAFIHPSS